MKRPYITVRNFMTWEYLVTGIMFLVLGLLFVKVGLNLLGIIDF